MNIVRKLVFDQRSILHFISAQRIEVNINSQGFPKSNEVLWIENVECIKPKANYDLSRCLDERSPHRNTVKDIITNPNDKLHLIGSEVSPLKMNLNGRISIIRSPEQPDTEQFKLRFCVHQTEENVKLSAILHRDGLRCEDLGYMLGIHRYTESQLVGDFSGITGMSWGLDTPPEPLSVPTINIKHTSKPPIDTKAHKTYAAIKEKLETVPLDKIKSIANITQDQAASADWTNLRVKRLTASLFGAVLKAINSEKFPPSLFNTLLNRYDLSHIPAIQWGVKHEDTAKEAYEVKTGVNVLNSGFWLHSSGILGASPDGLLPDGQGIVEFKCPYSIRDITVEDAIDYKPKFYLKRNDDDEVFLDKDHAYYHQIQGMLYIIGREYCDFCVWSPVGGPYIIRITKDPNWESCLIKLINFYFKQFLPHVIGSSDEKCLYEGYKELVDNIDSVLEDNKQKRIDRKNKLKSDDTDKSTLKSFDHDSQLPMISWEDIVKLSALTSTPFDEFHSKLWHAIREHRLTSSTFHRVLSAVKRNSYYPSLYKYLMDEYYMKNTPVAKFARANSIKAIDLYVKEKKLNVLPSGVWLDTSGVLGASVTGLVEDGKGIIDVRCLYKYRNMSDINIIIQLKDPLFHLEYNSEGVVVLKKSHRLYPQIQGGLYLAEREYCDIITWTQETHHICRVYKATDWKANIDILRKFHSEQLFPKLCEKWGYDNVIKDLMRFRK